MARADSETSAELEHSLRNEWNAVTVDYDVDRFPFSDWILERIRELGFELDALSEIHEVIPLDQTYAVTKKLCEATNEPDFRKMVVDFVHDVIVPAGKLSLPLAIQRFLNVRIMLPDRPEGIFPFHTGLLYGHGEASRSIWMPLTDVSAPDSYTASMQICDIERSRDLVREAIERSLSIAEMRELFGRESRPLHTKPGNVVLFGQENVHGNFVNVTGKTRVSIDFRVAEARYGNRLARKIAGGYFEVFGESAEPVADQSADWAQINNGKRNIYYLNNSTPYTFGIPVHLQRLALNDYCGRNEMLFDFELFELEGLPHMPTLDYVLSDLDANVVLYSIYSLPEEKALREAMYARAIAKEMVMHFANEAMVMADEDGIRRIERILEFAKYGDYGAVAETSPALMLEPDLVG